VEQVERGTDPDHDVTLPFTRMFLDRWTTRGRHAQRAEERFQSDWQSPMSQGTRCHQLAMYVVFESPLQMLRIAVKLSAGAGDDGVSGASADGMGRNASVDGKIAQYVAVRGEMGRSGTWVR